MRGLSDEFALVDLTIRLTEEPGGAEHVFRLVAGTAGPELPPACRIRRLRWQPLSGPVRISSFQSLVRPGCAPSSTAARRLPW